MEILPFPNQQFRNHVLITTSNVPSMGARKLKAKQPFTRLFLVVPPTELEQRPLDGGLEA
jgi:hypothetical protein